MIIIDKNSLVRNCQIKYRNNIIHLFIIFNNTLCLPVRPSVRNAIVEMWFLVIVIDSHRALKSQDRYVFTKLKVWAGSLNHFSSEQDRGEPEVSHSHCQKKHWSLKDFWRGVARLLATLNKILIFKCKILFLAHP